MAKTAEAKKVEVAPQEKVAVQKITAPVIPHQTRVGNKT